MNILVLMAGEDARDGAFPLWLGETGGDLLIERSVQAMAPLAPRRVVFAVRKSHIEAFHLDNIVSQIAPGCTVVPIRRDTAGAACTALLAIEHIDPNAELLVASATDHLDVDLATVIGSFRERGADAGVIVFNSLHPRYSYVRVDEAGWVIEAAEKNPISRHANAGFYWFARARDFFEAAQEMIAKDAQVNGVFYLCPTLNELVLRQKRVATWSIRADQYHPLKATRHAERLETRFDQVRDHEGLAA